jgi:alpha-beta hydrolase superfamily lysophospholipase
VYQRFGRRLAVDAYRVRVVQDASADLESVIAQVTALFNDTADAAPRVLVGSDTGALLALRLQAWGLVQADALVLAGMPSAREDHIFATWDDEVQARTACPTHQAWLSDQSRLSRGALTAERIPARLRGNVDASTVTVPVLGLHGVDDSISPLTNIRSGFALLPAARLVSVVGGKHDVLNDATHRSVAATVVLFLESLRYGPETPAITRLQDLSIERGLHRARRAAAQDATQPA